MSKAEISQGGFEIPRFIKTLAVAAIGALVVEIVRNAEAPQWVDDFLEGPTVR